MFWVLGIVAVFFFTTLGVTYVLVSKVNAQKAILLENILITQEELEEKKTILGELADINLGLVKTEVLDQLRADIAAEEEAIKAEKGRATITQAEMEAVDTRLRELEEIEKELENSGVEAARELEMLRAQEKDIQLRNNKLREQLESTLIQVDKLLHELASSHDAVQRLSSAKNEMTATQAKIDFYEQNITMLNKKYLDLKRAYDALDIEYAQLYEKQSQG